MSWEVIGTAEFADWFESLDKPTKARVIVVVDLLKEQGPALGRPYADTLEGSDLSNLKELRIRTIRVLYVFDPQRRAVLLLGDDKAGLWDKWYGKAMPEAEAIYKRYLKEIS